MRGQRSRGRQIGIEACMRGQPQGGLMYAARHIAVRGRGRLLLPMRWLAWLATYLPMLAGWLAG